MRSTSRAQGTTTRRVTSRPAEIEKPRRKPAFWGSTAVGLLLFLAAEYGLALWRLAHGSAEMSNKFSQLAKKEYLSFLIGENLRVLWAYAILLVVGIFLITPLTGVIFRKAAKPKRWLMVLSSLVIAVVMHGYFLMRLVHSRPYFLGEGDFGRSLEMAPGALRPVVDTTLFVILPWLFLGFVLFWWCRRLGTKGSVSLLLPVICAGAVYSFNREPQHVAPKPAAGGKPMNVIIIGSDSLRGDRLGYSGYRPQRMEGAGAAGVSPNIDAWAKDATRFSRCYTPIASTLESGVTVMSSSYPHTHGFRQMYPDKAQVEKTTATIHPIASVLNEKGYDTAAFGDWCAGYYQLMPLGMKEISVSNFDNFQVYMSQAVILAHFVVPLYFDNDLGYHLFPQIGSFAQFVTPEVVTRRVEEKLLKQASSGRPFFWHVHYSCNHLPYRTASPYFQMFSDPAYKGKNKTGVDFDINEFIGGTDLESKWKVLPETEMNQIGALYDGCTRNFDDCVGRIFAALKRNGLAENTIVVITADHGDDLFEPGVTLGHGLGFNGPDGCYHIPMAISVPGVKGSDVPEQIRSIDLSPTLLDLLKVDRPSAWEGQSVAPWIRSEAKPEDRPYYGETSFPFIQFKVDGVERPTLPPMDGLTFIDPSFNHQFVMRPEFPAAVNAAKQRCLRTRDWKVVCTPAKDGSRHFGLFHIASDPDSRQDLAGSRPEVLAAMKAALEKWIDQHQETPVKEIFGGPEPE